MTDGGTSNNLGNALAIIGIGIALIQQGHPMFRGRKSGSILTTAGIAIFSYGVFMLNLPKLLLIALLLFGAILEVSALDALFPNIRHWCSRHKVLERFSRAYPSVSLGSVAVLFMIFVVIDTVCPAASATTWRFIATLWFAVVLLYIFQQIWDLLRGRNESASIRAELEQTKRELTNVTTERDTIQTEHTRYMNNPYMGAIEEEYPFTDNGAKKAREDLLHASFLRNQVDNDTWQRLVMHPIQVEWREFRNPGDPNIRFIISVVNTSLYDIDLESFACTGQISFELAERNVNLQGTPAITTTRGTGSILQRGAMTDIVLTQAIGHLPKIMEAIEATAQAEKPVKFDLSYLDLSVYAIRPLTKEKRPWHFSLVRAGFETKLVLLAPKL